MGTKNKKIEIVTGCVSNHGNVDSIDNLRAYATPNLEVYRSMFLYDDTFTGDIKKYDGTFEINEIILDVDIKDGDLNNIKGLYAFLYLEIQLFVSSGESSQFSTNIAKYYFFEN